MIPIPPALAVIFLVTGLSASPEAPETASEAVQVTEAVQVSSTTLVPVAEPLSEALPHVIGVEVGVDGTAMVLEASGTVTIGVVPPPVCATGAFDPVTGCPDPAGLDPVVIVIDESQTSTTTVVEATSTTGTVDDAEGA